MSDQTTAYMSDKVVGGFRCGDKSSGAAYAAVRSVCLICPASFELCGRELPQSQIRAVVGMPVASSSSIMFDGFKSPWAVARLARYLSPYRRMSDDPETQSNMELPNQRTSVMFQRMSTTCFT